METNDWQTRVWRGTAASVARAVIPTGFAALDRALPGGGWPLGAITEIFVDGYGIGELGLLMPAMSALTSPDPAKPRKWIAWIAPPFVPYAPALQQHGVDVDCLLMIHPTPGGKSRLWAIEQVVRSGSSAGVLAWVAAAGAGRDAGMDAGGRAMQEQLPIARGRAMQARAEMPAVEQRREQLPRAIADDVMLRRLQLAAEDQGCWVLLFRPADARQQRSPAALRLRLAHTSTSTRVEILKCRGGRPGVVDLADFARVSPAAVRASRS